jgi:hypothetical protein
MGLVYCESKGEVMDKSHLIETLSRDTGLTLRKAEEVVIFLALKSFLWFE